MPDVVVTLTLLLLASALLVLACTALPIAQAFDEAQLKPLPPRVEPAQPRLGARLPPEPPPAPADEPEPAGDKQRWRTLKSATRQPVAPSHP